MWKELKPFAPMLWIASALTVGAIVLTNVLDSRSGHLSGFNFEERVGNRRIGSTGHGTSATVSGPGFAAVQRARPVRHTSMTFERDNAEEVLTDGLTELSFLDTPVAIGSGGFEYDLTFRLPKWGERTPDPSSTHDKGLANTIFASGKLGNLLVLDMDLQSCGQAVQGAPATPPVNIPYDTGGVSFCLGEIVDQDSGPFSSFPVGDRQRGCTVGDVVTIHYDGTDYKGQVVATQVLSLATTEDVTGTSPNASAPGITQAVIDFHQRCDRVIIALEGKTGQDLEDLFDSLGDLDGLTVSHVKHEAIAPPTIYVDGVEGTTGFEPTITAVDMNDNFSIHVLTKGVDYIWDPVAGVVYIDRSRLPASDLRLHYRGHVYDTRKTLFAEDICNLNEAFDGMLEGFVSYGPFSSGTVVEAGFHIAEEGPTVIYSIISTAKGAIDDEDDPGFEDFNFPGDEDTRFGDFDGQFEKISFTKTAGSDFAIGVEFQSYPYLLGYYMKFPVRFLDRVPRIHPNELAQAFIDVSLGNGRQESYDQTKSNWEYSGPGKVDSFDFNVKVLGVWYTDNGDGTVSLEALDDEVSALSGIGALTEIESNSNGTVDITQTLKAAIARQWSGDTSGRIALIVVPESFSIDIFQSDSWSDFIYSGVEKYEASNWGSSLPADHDLSFKRILFDGMTLGGLKIKYNKDELIETDYWAEDGGIADSPALDWTAPAP